MRPTKLQIATLKWLRGVPEGAFVEDVPRRTAWYARDVLTRMAKRGWVEKTAGAVKHLDVFKITDAGRKVLHDTSEGKGDA